jgi:hypothetical protein
MRYEPQGGAGQDRLDETTATICREIRTLIAKGDAAGEEFYREAGQQIKELKRLHPDRWLVMVREECGLGRSRAFELMAIADGRTTAEEVRSNHTQRKRISRKRQAESGTSRTPEPAAMPVATVVSISAASDEQIGAFLDQLSIDHFFAVLQFAPTLQAEITKRVLALHDRKVALPIAAPNADSSSQTNVLDSIKQSRAVAEAYRKILKVSPFDRGGEEGD